MNDKLWHLEEQHKREREALALRHRNERTRLVNDMLTEKNLAFLQWLAEHGQGDYSELKEAFNV